MKINNIKIIDCTLRDGGYINDWKFDDNHIIEIINSLQLGNIDIIECGYISKTYGEPSNSSRFDSVESLERILRRTNKHSSSQKYVAMINLGEIDPCSLPAHMENMLLSGLRLAFHKKDLPEAWRQAEIIIDKGYDLFVQPMVSLNYSDKEFVDAIDSFSKLSPKAFYIVDSFGSMKNNDLTRLAYLLANNLPQSISFGFHSHNNMQLSYASAIQLTHMQVKHEIIIDTSILGMGRGAGNLNTEIFADYLNNHSEVKYEITPLLDVIDSYLEPIYRKKPWGFSVAHFLSAATGCHPSYASFFLNRKTLPVKTIRDIINQIPPQKKVSFDQDFAEKVYLETRSKNHSKIVDIENVSFPDSKDVRLLVLGSGPSIRTQCDRIRNFIKKHNCCVVSLNHIPEDIKVDYYFFSNQKRFNEHSHEIQDSTKLIITSNIITESFHELKCRYVDYNALAKSLPSSSDNVALLFAEFAHRKRFESIYFCGLDGYSLNTSNNYYNNPSVNAVNETFAEEHNRAISDGLLELAKRINIKFVTTSLFQSVCPLKTLGVIPARYQSSRFEGKPLALIAGVPMIKRTYDQALKSKSLDSLIVATEDERIFNYCKANSMKVIMTSGNCLTGTDRIAEVAEKLDYDFYINIQGDEPVISPNTIELIIGEYRQHLEEYAAYNLYKEISIPEEISSNTIIKVIFNDKKELMYMSRHPVPYNKGEYAVEFNKQVCVYGFTKHALEAFRAQKEKTCNEQYEDIEILRFIDMGYKVKMIKTEYDSIAVDIPEDISKIESFLSENILK